MAAGQEHSGHAEPTPSPAIVQRETYLLSLLLVLSLPTDHRSLENFEAEIVNRYLSAALHESTVHVHEDILDDMHC